MPPFHAVRAARKESGGFFRNGGVRAAFVRLVVLNALGEK